MRKHVWRVAVGLILAGATRAEAVTIEMVPVARSLSPEPGFAAVPYDYTIGKYEVTNAEYTEFLNAKAASDPWELFNSAMGNDPRGGIQRTGAAGSYSYVVREHMGNKPVNFVSFYDAARFTNWLHNGQADGDTESGAYSLGNNIADITRNSGAKWFLPSQAEWIKAAYHEPGTSGFPGNDYWDYPTRYNPIPASANANGDLIIPFEGALVANFNNKADWNGLDGNVTTVGSAGADSATFYGTYDQGGNVWEVIDSIPRSEDGPPSTRLYVGGGWDGPGGLVIGNRIAIDATLESSAYGFRVASIPEPTSLLLIAIGAAFCAMFRARRQQLT